MSDSRTSNHEQPTTRECALRYFRAGLRVIPVKLGGSKAPDMPNGYAHLRAKRAEYTEETVKSLFPEWKRCGIALVLGEYSGGLFCFDHEYADFADEFATRVSEKIPRLANKFPSVRSPGKSFDAKGGRHHYFRFAGAKNEPRLAEIDQKESVERTGSVGHTTAIEVRASDLILLVPGGDPDAHKTGTPYRMVDEIGIEEAPEITKEEYDTMVAIGRSLSRTPQRQKDEADYSKRREERRAKLEREGVVLPGDDFNSSEGVDIKEILKGHFDHVFTGRNEVEYFRRVGKDEGISATWGYCRTPDGLPLFHNFSTNASPFEANRTYDLFGVYAFAVHGGDFAAATRTLAKLGKGTPLGRKSPAVVVADSDASPISPTEEEDESTFSFDDSALPFPLDVFPPRIADYCREVSEAKDAPIDFAAAMVLGVASGAIGACRKVVWKKDHIEMANLYMALVGGASSGKSPTFREVLRPMDAEAERLAKDYKSELERHELEVFNAKNAKTLVSTRPPVQNEIHVEDFTVESLIPMLAANRRGLTNAQDELTMWLESMNKYTGKGSNTDRSFYLYIWNGKGYKKNRRTNSESILTGDVFMSIFGGIQPSRLPAITGGNISGDGFADRFLFVFPEPKPLKPYDFEKTVSESARMVWGEVYAELRKMKYAVETDFHGNEFEKAVEVPISDAARFTFSGWDVEHIRDTNEKLIPPHLHSVWGKFRSHFPRLALVIHCLRVAEKLEDKDDPISGSSAIAAMRLCEYFKSHARKVYSTFPESKIDQQSLELLHWMRRQNPARIAQGWTANQLRNSRRVKKASEADKLLDDLVDRGAGIFDLSGKVFKPYV